MASLQDGECRAFSLSLSLSHTPLNRSNTTPSLYHTLAIKERLRASGAYAQLEARVRDLEAQLAQRK